MSELRKEFEKIAYKNKWNINKDPHGFYVDDFVNGAWWAFEEQQTKIDELQLKNHELTKTMLDKNRDIVRQAMRIEELAKELSTTKQVLHNVIDMERAKKSELEKKIDAAKMHIDLIKKIVSECDENKDSSWILGNIDGFIECMEKIINDQSN